MCTANTTGDPVVCGVPQARPPMYALLIPAASSGVESEMELDYAGLHQLCAPVLDHLGRLPAPQRDALATVFGRSAGVAPDRFLVGPGHADAVRRGRRATAAGLSR
jgi:hypothetical protein